MLERMVLLLLRKETNHLSINAPFVPLKRTATGQCLILFRWIEWSVNHQWELSNCLQFIIFCCNCVQPIEGGWTTWSLKSLCNPNHFLILCSLAKISEVLPLSSVNCLDPIKPAQFCVLSTAINVPWYYPTVVPSSLIG